MLKKELQSIWKDKKFTLSIIVMVFMPILYSGMLLWAFWDPYAKLDELPVALVNEDQGAVLDGEQITLGNDLIDKLMDDPQFNFFEVDAKDAKKQLKNHEYYLLIQIPENFSENATTLLTDSPQKLELHYLPNEGYNFLSSKVGDTAIEKIREAVNKEVAKTYASTLFESIATLNEGFVDASDGAIKLSDGVMEVLNGSSDLKSYLTELAQSTVTLQDGTKALENGLLTASEGSKEVANGAHKLSDGSAQAVDGAKKIADGSTTLHEGIASYTAGVDEIATNYNEVVEKQQALQSGINQIAEHTATLASNSQNLASGAANLQQGLTQLSAILANYEDVLSAEEQAALQQVVQSLSAGTAQLAAGTAQFAEKTGELSAGTSTIAQNAEALTNGHSQLNNGLQKVSEQSNALENGAKTVADGNNSLAFSLSELQTGAKQLANGASSLNEGLTTAATSTGLLADGTKKLSEGSIALEDGASKLVDGTTELSDGSKTLAEALTDAAKESELTYTDETVDMTVSPVEVKKEVVNEVDNYGSGFAPYFVSLGLFVGALLLTNVYPYVQPAVHPTSVVSWFISKSFIPLVVMIGQIVFILCVLLFALGLNVDNIALLILTTAITSFAFMAVVQVLTVVLGDVGRFIALLFLIIQLTASAGTFPIEMLPEFFQTIHQFMPMTYSIQAYRDVIAGDYVNFASSITILGTVGVVSVAISFAFFVLLFKKRYSKQVA